MPLDMLRAGELRRDDRRRRRGQHREGGAGSVCVVFGCGGVGLNAIQGCAISRRRA
jgi:hypothetical protein